jgi:hypothetical protein
MTVSPEIRLQLPGLQRAAVPGGFFLHRCECNIGIVLQTPISRDSGAG